MSQIDEALKMLQQGVKELPNSEQYKRYLDVMSKFYSYSVNNILLITMQMPMATYVASYTGWRDKFHRQVMQGEKGLTIIAPTPYKKTRQVEAMRPDGTPILNPDGTPVMQQEESTHIAFRICKVFDISQTEGEPLPELISELTNPVENFADYLLAIEGVSPVPIKYGNIDGSAKGYYSPTTQEIVIRRGMSEEQTLKTILHECVHARLGHGSEDDVLTRRTQEVQAESIAYCCCKALGIDTAEYSFPYIASWAADQGEKALTDNLQVIKDQSEQMISRITKRLRHIWEFRQEKNVMSISAPTISMNM